ncbi:hypothetical protein [Hymenobacter pini]|uniref:hypothetical protein n=1 Tax=Hymenobacter pini TaxID=2880879 RepID=UPI001CF12636|nr:hypothetical protein [Hymenobacter pini]MCA8833308.1 hypothetical protein [Hymenobacter pini]
MDNAYPELRQVLAQAIDGLRDPDNYYSIYTTRYDYDGQTYMTNLLFWQQDAVWDIELGDENVQCDVLLDRSAPEHRFRISIPYDHIYGVQHGNSPNFTTTRGMLYDAPEVLHRTLQAFTDELKRNRPQPES